MVELTGFQVERVNNPQQPRDSNIVSVLHPLEYLTRDFFEDCAGSSIIFKEGLCAANLHNPQQPRDGVWYLENILNPLIKSGKISDGSHGPFDDRKFWYAGCRLEATDLGTSMFQ